MRRGAAPSVTNHPPPQAWRVWAALGAIYVIWGSTYLAIRLMVETVPPALGAGVRFVLAGVLMLAVLVAPGGGLRAIAVSGRALLGAATVGTLLAAGGNGLVTVAERNVPSGLAALLIATVPLWIVLYRTLSGDRVARATLGGVALGFTGVAILLLPGGRPDAVRIGMALLIVLAAASWGLGSVVAQRVETPADPLVSTAWQLLSGGVVLVAGGLLAGEGGSVDVSAFSTKSLLALAYLILIGSIVAFTCYSWLLAHAPISQVATYAYVNPVIAVALGAVFLSEEVAALTVAGMALVVGSVALTVRQESGGSGPPGPAEGRDELRETTETATVPVASRN
jgi:drug/metabolite transporter (DMT)-like permease